MPIGSSNPGLSMEELVPWCLGHLFCRPTTVPVWHFSCALNLVQFVKYACALHCHAHSLRQKSMLTHGASHAHSIWCSLLNTHALCILMLTHCAILRESFGAGFKSCSMASLALAMLLHRFLCSFILHELRPRNRFSSASSRVTGA